MDLKHIALWRCGDTLCFVRRGTMDHLKHIALWRCGDTLCFVRRGTMDHLKHIALWRCGIHYVLLGGEQWI